ncbi:MAG: NADH-quinone oxidoreductase subunit L [Armatimonadota bacterium]
MTVATPLLGTVLVWLLGLTSDRLMKTFAVLVAVATGVLTVLLLLQLPASNGEEFVWIPQSAIFIGFNLTGFGVWVAVVAGVIGALTVIYSVRYMEPEEETYAPTRYYSLTILFIGSMIGLALTDNLIVMYIFWEMIGFCSYMLIAYYYEDPRAVRAGTKAFVVTRFGDIGLLVGIVVLWQAAGTTNVFEIMEAVKAGAIPALELSVAGIGFILAAAGKSAQFPLHVWLPDAMEAPTTISALIHAACLVNAGVYLLALTYPMFMGLGWWLTAVIWMGAITALVAGILALIEWDLKRVLAYSTVSQLGFMVAAVGAGGIYASQFHLINHAIFKALLFLCAGAIIHAVHTRDMRQMGGLGRLMPVTQFTTLVGVLALSGIPVLNGFWSKDLIMESLIHAGPYAYIPMWLLMASALLTAMYSLRMYFMVFKGEGVYEAEPHDAPPSMSGVLVILSLAAMVFWLGVDFYSDRLVQGLTIHHVEGLSLAGLAHAVTSVPVLMGLTVVVVVLFFGLWIAWSATGRVLSAEGAWAQALIDTKFGLDAFYAAAVTMIEKFCQQFRRLQTGDLNYNVAGMAFGLILLLLLLASNLLQVNSA